VILLPSASETDLLSAPAGHHVLPHCLAGPARPRVQDLPALAEGADLVALRPPGARPAHYRGLDTEVGVPGSCVGQIAAALTATARERGRP
jgi:hypothetical protein